MNLGRETEILEFKKSTSELKEAMIDICSMLNKHGHGEVYFGVKPNGDVCGFDIGASTIDDVARAIKSSIKPQIAPVISEVKYDNLTCIKVKFSGTELPYSANGRYYIRVADRAEEMTPSQLRSMMFSTDYSSSWENILAPFGIEDVDHETVDKFYKKAVICGRIQEISDYSDEKLLTVLGLMKDGKLNNAGYYLFSSKKPIVLKITNYVSKQRLNISAHKRISGNIYNLIDEAYSYIMDKIDWAVTAYEGTKRVEEPEVPVEAIREIVVNAFAHANYRDTTEHEINITPNEIEIYNPGSFPMNLTPEMFVNDNRKSQPRNKLILDTLFKSKDVEIIGSGFRKVYHLCKLDNINTKYSSNEDGFSFTFLRRKRTVEAYAIPEYVSMRPLMKNEINVLDEIKNNSDLSRKDIANSLNLSIRTVQRIINKLEEYRYIYRVGSKKCGHWAAYTYDS